MLLPRPDDSASSSSMDLRPLLPIEGITPWPFLLRLIAIGSFATVMLFSFIFMLMIPPEQLMIDAELLLIALGSLVVFEIVLVRRLIIPMNGDYGRYRISEGRVDFYPLSTLGLTVMTRPQSVPVSDFRGIEIQSTPERQNLSRYTVALAHDQKANMVRIRSFAVRDDAEAYARNLAALLSLPLL